MPALDDVVDEPPVDVGARAGRVGDAVYERSRIRWPSPVGVRMHFEKEALVCAREKYRLIPDMPGGTDVDLRKQRGDIIRMQPDAPVRHEAVDAGG
ncbi:MAG TPA: hypothetical protein VHI99_26960 [Vicinamibacterales bacterium]|nr:hypothetical protein [Vicinamibacterales bacterium]